MSPVTGSPPHSTRLLVARLDGAPVVPGEVGNMLEGNGMIFECYTGAAPARLVDSLCVIGDRGHLLADGCLVLDSCNDNMAISGGENVYLR